MLARITLTLTIAAIAASFIIQTFGAIAEVMRNALPH